MPAELLATIELPRLKGAGVKTPLEKVPEFARPPPAPAELFVIVELVTLKVPPLVIAPPLPLLTSTELLVKVELLTPTVPLLLAMAPPVPLLPEVELTVNKELLILIVPPSL